MITNSPLAIDEAEHPAVNMNFKDFYIFLKAILNEKLKKHITINIFEKTKTSASTLFFKSKYCS